LQFSLNSSQDGNGIRISFTPQNDLRLQEKTEMTLLQCHSFVPADERVDRALIPKVICDVNRNTTAIPSQNPFYDSCGGLGGVYRAFDPPTTGCRLSRCDSFSLIPDELDGTEPQTGQEGIRIIRQWFTNRVAMWYSNPCRAFEQL